MATIVVHKQSGRKYVLIGTGYGAYKAMMPSMLGGTLFPHEEAKEIPVAAVSDRNGNILWLSTEELVVTEVDGTNISDLLESEFERQPGRIWPGMQAADGADSSASGAAATGERGTGEYDTCPGCSQRVAVGTMECPSCGLALIVVEDE